MPRYVIEYQRDSGGWELSGNRHSDGSGRHLLDVDFPSLEAAQREAEVQHRAYTSIRAYRARDTEAAQTQEGVNMAGVVSTEPATRPRAVRIYRRNREWVVDVGGRTEPIVQQLHPYMPATLRQACRDRGDYSIKDALVHGASPQALSAAISAWYVEHPNSSGAITQEEGLTELPDVNAYLAYGDNIYKMVAVRQASSSKAIRLMREKVRRDVEAIRVGLTQQASQESQSIIQQAQQQAARIRGEAQRELYAAQSGARFPAWTNGLPVKIGTGLGDSGQLFAMQKTQLVITELSHGDKRWLMNPDRKAIRVNFWLPLSGLQDFVRLEEGSPSLPHVTHASCCLKIGEKIQPINSQEKLKAFSAQVTRALSVINLASLLQANIITWNPEVVALLPAPIKKWLETYTSMHVQRDDPIAIAALPPTDILERREETWSTL